MLHSHVCCDTFNLWISHLAKPQQRRHLCTWSAIMLTDHHTGTSVAGLSFRAWVSCESRRPPCEMFFWGVNVEPCARVSSSVTKWPNVTRVLRTRARGSVNVYCSGCTGSGYRSQRHFSHGLFLSYDNMVRGIQWKKKTTLLLRKTEAVSDSRHKSSQPRREKHRWREKRTSVSVWQAKTYPLPSWCSYSFRGLRG